MCSTNNSRNYIFFEESTDKTRIEYTLTNRYGEGFMSLSVETFIDVMQRLGFQGTDSFSVLVKNE